MISMQEVGIEGPLKRLPGQKLDAPYYVQYTGPIGPRPSGAARDDDPSTQSGNFVSDPAAQSDIEDHLGHKRSILRQPSGASRRSGRPRGESITAMAKRVDFSLGMRDISSSGDMMGDLYDNVSPGRIPGGRRDSASRARDRIVEEDEEQLKKENEGHSTSRTSEGPSRLKFQRSSTTESGSRLKRSFSAIHRNRFFPRHGRRNSRGEYEDLMEQGMADIPESAGSSGRIDPRSGRVSSQAVRTTTEDDLARGRLPGTTAHGGQGPFGGPSRSQTENFEMRNMKR